MTVMNIDSLKDDCHNYR